MHRVDPSTNRPEPEIRIKEVTVFVDPFEEFLEMKKKHQDESQGETEKDTRVEQTDDDQVTWTGKKVRTSTGLSSVRGNSGGGGGEGVGKYLKAALAEQRARGREDEEEDESAQKEEEEEEEPVRKKIKGRKGFGDFSSW